MIRTFRKIKEVGYVDFDMKANRDIIKRGLLLGQIGLNGYERLVLDAKTKKIERVPEGSIIQGRTLRKFERGLAGYYEDKPKIVELKKNMAVVLPYEIETHNGRLYDILAVDDEGQLLFANSKSYYVENEKGKWYRPFAKKN